MKPNIDEICELYKIDKEQAEQVLCMYDSAKKNLNGFCLMGRRSVLDDTVGKREPEKLSPFVTLDAVANFYYTDESQYGNVLASLNWNVAKNDAWVLGGIDSNGTFNMVCSFEIRDNKDIENFMTECVITKDSTYPHTVTAREIIGLMTAGYIPVIAHGALLFVPGKSTTDMSIVKYNAAIQKYKLNSTANADKEYVESVIKEFLTQGFVNYELMKN